MELLRKRRHPDRTKKIASPVNKRAGYFQPKLFSKFNNFACVKELKTIVRDLTRTSVLYREIKFCV